jgi:hypothetical protein
MNLKEIMSVSGQGGLFKFVSQGRNGIIVESFADKKRSFVSASSKVNSLEDIAVFTDEEEVPLKTVLKSIFDMEQGNAAPDPKSSPDILKNFMAKVLPNYDRERVYVSDIKKLVSWYNTLRDLDLLKFDEEPVPETAETNDNGKEISEAGPKQKTTTAKPKKSPATKKVTGKPQSPTT